MKPQNKFQKQIVEASKKLPKITQTQIDWAYKNCIEHYARRTKKGILSCLECGHQWTDKDLSIQKCNCPSCNAELKVIDTKQRTSNQWEYLAILTTYGEYQVLRFLYVEYKAKVGKPAEYKHAEAIQRWIAPDGRYATLAMLRPMGYFVNTWSWTSKLELRPDKNLYNACPTCIYPRQKIQPELIRRGYKGDFYGMTPFDLFHALLTDTKAETLLKAGQTILLKHCIYRMRQSINKYWASIKICIRNGYIIQDAQMWCDYIDLLSDLGKDLHNAKYVCPIDLKAEHDRFVQKKREWLTKQTKEEARKKALQDEKIFKKAKAIFFGIHFTDGLIDIRVLESVQEIVAEGDAMHHCVYTNDYHLKSDSLILSACMNGRRLETIELSISKLKILQSQGVCNQPSEYHNRILKLVEKNMPLIEKRLVA